MASTMLGFAKPTLLATPTKAGAATVTQSQLPPSQAVPSSTTQPGHPSRAQADSSRKEKVGPPPQKGCGVSAPPNRVFVPQKQQIQEKAVNEVKTAIKPFYQRKEITKDEYKEIVRKAVEKVSTSSAPFALSGPEPVRPALWESRAQLESKGGHT